MYCRECGNQMSDTAVSCGECGTRKGEGVKFCQMCGHHTTERTEFCFHCGAKQRNILSQKMRNAKLAELQKKAHFNKKLMKIDKFIAIAGLVATVVLIAVLVLRPEPSGIPDISSVQMSSNSFVHDSLQKVGNTYYYSSNISDEVAEYWVQGRALIGYIAFCLFISLVSFIRFKIQKHSYKKILKSIKEAKNVL